MPASHRQPLFDPPPSTRALPITLVISGDTPSKKNSKQLIQVKGRTIPISSKHYRVWEKAALKELQWNDGPLPDGCSVEITIFPGTRRAADLSNKAESILDAMVLAGIIADDNWYIIPSVVLKFGGVDRFKPRAEVVISR